MKTELTPLRPSLSAIVPLTIAPIIAPTVSMEPKTEYCTKKDRTWESKVEIRQKSRVKFYP